LVTGTAPTTFTVDLSDPADPSTVQASDFTVNGTPADNVTLLNGNATLQFDFNTSPVVQGENTMHIDGRRNSPSIEWRSNPGIQLHVPFRCNPANGTDTNPPVGGTFTGLVTKISL